MKALRNGTSIEERALPVLPPEEFRRAVLRGAEGGRIVAFFGRPLGEGVRLYAVLADDAAGTLAALASDVGDRFLSLTPDCPQAHNFEREICEQHGVHMEGHPWLKPLRSHAAPYSFFQVEGEEIHEVAVGPVHAGLIDPGHFRLQCHGEKVLSLEIHLGYQHRGVEEALENGPDKRAALLAECAAGDTTIGHALAYALAVEALSGSIAPPRAQAIRAIALELERVANHVGDLGALGADIGFLPTAAWFGRLRGEFLNLLATLSGNRYGRGLIRPGGVLCDVPAQLADDATRRLSRARDELRQVAGLFFETSSVRSRIEGTGVLTRQECNALALLGPAARACGTPRDVRRDHPPPGASAPPIPVAIAMTGDVFARSHVRWMETQHSLEYLIEGFRALPAGAIRAACGPPAPGRLAVSLVEGWRGEIAHVALTGEDGRFARYKIKDPSFQNWTALTLAMRGTQISDFPLCNKSFNLSYAGHDL
ncbi:MAG TPA: hydrogenase [Candidatus Polarisedimenticolia bacterium]|nr:hydrogenase [Candidatus Polarisedimenticolia bacterium]